MRVASLLRLGNKIKTAMYRVQRGWRCGLWWGVGEQSQAFGEAWRAETPGRCWWTGWRKTNQNKDTVKLLASGMWCPSVFTTVSDTEGHWKKTEENVSHVFMSTLKLNSVFLSLQTQKRQPQTQELKSSTTPWSLAELHLSDIFFCI